jgi:excinuclease UvrABC nuclease subunit
VLAPCVGKVDQERHREIVDDFCDFMAGQSGRFVKRLEREMAEARRPRTTSGAPGCGTTSAR